MFIFTCRNLVSTVNWMCKLDLEAIALQSRSAVYKPKASFICSFIVNLIQIPSVLCMQVCVLHARAYFFLCIDKYACFSGTDRCLWCKILCSISLFSLWRSENQKQLHLSILLGRWCALLLQLLIEVLFVCGFLNIVFKFQILCVCLRYDHVPNVRFAKPNNFTLYFWRVNFSFLWCCNLTRFVLEAMRNSLNWLQGRCVLVLLSVYLIHAMYAYYWCSPLKVNHTR